MIKAKALDSRKALTLAIGAVVAMGALFAALLIVGPVVRYVFGDPADFNQDYTSKGAFWQCIAVQEATLALAFFAFGFLFRAWRDGKPLNWSLWAANPVSVGFGFWLYRNVMSLQRPAEYFGYPTWVLLSLLAPLTLAPCVMLGIWLRNHRDSSEAFTGR